MSREVSTQSIRTFVAEQPRVVWFLLALVVVWIAAPDIRDFISGFLDGASGARR